MSYVTLIFPYILALCSINKSPLIDNGLGIHQKSPQQSDLAATIDITWLFQGYKTTVYSPNFQNQYPGICITSGFRCLINADHKNFIALTTQDYETVFITIADKPRKEFDLIKHVDRLNKSLYQKTTKHNTSVKSVSLPMVDASSKQPLKSFSCNLPQVRCIMKRNGAHKDISKWRSGIEINQPFFMWICKKNSQTPYFAGYIDQSDWKKPTNLKD